MDLDKLKDTWNKTDIQPEIDDEKIIRMLDKKGKGALQRLLWFECLGVILVPVLVVMVFIYNQCNPKVPYSIFTIIWFYSFCTLVFFWQIFKLKLLKRINPENNDILTSFKTITRYKKYVRYELFVGCVWLIIFVISHAFTILSYVSENRFMSFVITLSVATVLVIVFILLLYRKLYYKNINSIKRSIEEIKDFEEGNE